MKENWMVGSIRLHFISIFVEDNTQYVHAYVWIETLPMWVMWIYCNYFFRSLSSGSCVTSFASHHFHNRNGGMFDVGGFIYGQKPRVASENEAHLTHNKFTGRLLAPYTFEHVLYEWVCEWTRKSGMTHGIVPSFHTRYVGKLFHFPSNWSWLPVIFEKPNAMWIWFILVEYSAGKCALSLPNSFRSTLWYCCCHWRVYEANEYEEMAPHCTLYMSAVYTNVFRVNGLNTLSP